MEEIIEIFRSVLGEPNDLSLLEEYVLFCLENKIDKTGEVYSENHHILPKAKFKWLEKDKRFQVRLEYMNHVKAHFILAEAYPIKSFVSPLRKMPKDLDNKLKYNMLNSLAASISSKLWWAEFSKDAVRLAAYKEERSIFKKTHQGIGSTHHKAVCAGVQAYYAAHPERKEEIRSHKTDWWAGLNEEEYSIICNKMMWKDSDSYDARVQKLTDRYKDEVFYDQFHETMKIVNADPTKRKNAGATIRNKWKNDDEYKEKMANRKKRGSDGSKMKDIWEDPDHKDKIRDIKIASGAIKTIEYCGVCYYGWDELKEKTGLTPHFFNKWKKENESK